MFKIDWEVKILSFKVDIKATIISIVLLMLSMVIINFTTFSICNTTVHYNTWNNTLVSIKTVVFVTVVVALCATYYLVTYIY